MVVHKHCYQHKCYKTKEALRWHDSRKQHVSLPFTDRVQLFSSPRRATPTPVPSETFKLLCRVSGSADGCYIINHRPC